MAECQNCGSFVSDSYARVFTPDEEEGPRVCPSCPDKQRVNVKPEQYKHPQERE